MPGRTHDCAGAATPQHRPAAGLRPAAARAHACGVAGYIADPGYFDVPDLANVGFPFADVYPDGNAVVSKLDGTGGRIDRLTCTAQLLY